MVTCRNESCPREVWERDGDRCILHSRRPDKLTDFNKYLMDLFGRCVTTVHDLQGVIFPNGARIENVHFIELPKLQDAQFRGLISFNHVGFAQGFSLSQLNPNPTGDVKFNNVRFSRGLNIDVLIDKKLVFRRCSFNEEHNQMKDGGFSNINFGENGKIEFHNCEFCTGEKFATTDLKRIEFYHCKWPIIGNLFGKHFSFIGDPEHPEIVETEYRRFRHKFEEEAEFHFACRFHISEMEMQLLWRKNELGKRRIFNLYYLFLLSYRILSAYGNSFARVLGWWTLTFVAFVMVFTLSGLRETGSGGEPHNPVVIKYAISDLDNEKILTSKEFLHDVRRVAAFTFSTFYLGRTKHLEPIGPTGELWEALASVVGLVLTALFILALRRNFRSLKG